MKTKKDNKGFTLIELIIVVAIMAVLVGGIGLSYNRVSRAGVKTTALETKTVISECRVSQMSKSGVFTVDIYMGTDGCFYGRVLKDGEVDASAGASAEKKFGRNGISLDLLPQSATSSNYATVAAEATLTEGKHLYLTFRRSSGRVSGFLIDADEKTKDQLTAATGIGFPSGFSQTGDVKLRISQGGYAYLVSVRCLTGSIDMEIIS